MWIEFLHISYNSLRNLYGIETLGHNTSELKQFIFVLNRINYIQPEILYTRNLSVLALSNNQLTFLPMENVQIDTPSHLDIRSNLFNAKKLNTIVQTFKRTHPNLTLIY